MNNVDRNILHEIEAERARTRERFTEEFDTYHQEADWINFIVRYASGAAPRLETRKDLAFRDAMIKVAALALAAVEWCDNEAEARKSFGNKITGEP